MAPSGDTLPGDPQAVDELASRLRSYAEQSADAAARLSRLDSVHWSGAAAEQFRAAVLRVPAHLASSHDAFAAAQSALSEYALVLREAKTGAHHALEIADAATAATHAWEADGAVGPDPGLRDREHAQQLLGKARQRVAAAGAKAAGRLREIAASAPPPSSETLAGRSLTLRTDGATMHAVTAHPLRDPDGFVDGAGRHSTALRYGAAHHVGFADGTNGSTSWESWIGSGESRGLGRVATDSLAALGLGVLGVAAANRRRPRGRLTAMAEAGADPADLAANRPARSGGTGVVSARVQDGGMRTSSAWRTNLAYVREPVRTWPASVPTYCSITDSKIVLDAASAIRHCGAPEGFPKAVSAS